MPKPVVVVTGASRGIGLAITRILLADFNAVVVAISRSCSPELFGLGLVNKDLDIVACDVANTPLFTSVLHDAHRKHHSIDGLILNAGVLDPVCKVGDGTPLEEWKHHFDVNFFSLVTAIQSTLPALRQSHIGGRVVFISSGAALKGTGGWGPYNASKAAMNSLCRTLATEEADLTAVALRPGMVDTNLQADVRSTGASVMSPEEHQIYTKAFSEGKLVKPEDCGYVAAALSLSAPKALSGQFVSWDSEDCQPFRREAKA